MFVFTLFLDFLSSWIVLGILPINKAKFSPFMASDTFFCCCSFAKCGNRSVIVNTGSFSFSPIDIVSFSPFAFIITPWIASGMVVH